MIRESSEAEVKTKISSAMSCESRLLKPAEAFVLLGVGRSKGYELIARNAIPGIDWVIVVLESEPLS